MREFQPRLDILPPAQRDLWPELAETPPEFTLYGGTAIALQLGHRQSADFDFFTTAEFEPGALARRVRYLNGGEIVQSSKDTLTVRIRRGDWISLSFFKPPYIRPFASPLVASENKIKVAALIDLAGIKAEVVHHRAAAKDYVDLDALIASGIPLIEALAAAKILHGEMFNPWITIKALFSYAEGDLKSVGNDIRQRLQKAADEVDVHDIDRTMQMLRQRYRGGK